MEHYSYYNSWNNVYNYSYAPWSLFAPIYNTLSLVKLPISLGTAPEKSLYAKLKILKYVQFDRVDGIPPWNMFLDKEKNSRKGRLLQIFAGICPES